MAFGVVIFSSWNLSKVLRAIDDDILLAKRTEAKNHLYLSSGFFRSRPSSSE